MHSIQANTLLAESVQNKSKVQYKVAIMKHVHFVSVYDRWESCHDMQFTVLIMLKD